MLELQYKRKKKWRKRLKRESKVGCGWGVQAGTQHIPPTSFSSIILSDPICSSHTEVIL